MNWKKVQIITDNCEKVSAQAPLIVSASRSTDIPAFYANWFFNRLKNGYSAWINPFNGVKNYVSYEDVRFIVFWSKNPKPLLKHLPYLRERGVNCYIQYTLNDYVSEKLEMGVPSLKDRIDTFKRLSDYLGKDKIIWRFDPLILTDRISVDDLIDKIAVIGEQLKDYTNKLVFSFADIIEYGKVRKNLENSGVKYRNFTPGEMNYLAVSLSNINKRWNLELATCAEKVDLDKYGISHNRCVDDRLMAKIAWQDDVLMKFLGMEVVHHFGSDFGTVIPPDAIVINDTIYVIRKKDNKDKGQRLLCGCAISKDIGQYNTCAHLCEYCYANAGKEAARDNYKRHLANPDGECIINV